MIISNKDTAIKRQLEALKALTSKVEGARRKVEAIVIEKSKDDDAVAQWNNQIGEEILDQSLFIYAWVDSLVVLHLICGQGTHKQANCGEDTRTPRNSVALCTHVS